MTENREDLTSYRHMRTKRCRHGLMLFNANDKYVGRSLNLYGEFSEGEIEIFEQVLRPGMVACDIGANIGSHTVFMSKVVGPEGVIVAFEPQRIVFQNLCANLALNAIENVHAYHSAAGQRAGKSRVPVIRYDLPENFGGVTIGSHHKGELVEVTPLDELPFNNCHFIKIDVEGMEIEVLKGANDTIKKFRPVIYVENDRPNNSQELIECLFAADYRLYWHLPCLFNLENFFKNSDNVFGDLISINMLGVPKEKNTKVDDLEEITSLSFPDIPSRIYSRN